MKLLSSFHDDQMSLFTKIASSYRERATKRVILSSDVMYSNIAFNIHMTFLSSFKCLNTKIGQFVPIRYAMQPTCFMFIRRYNLWLQYTLQHIPDKGETLHIHAYVSW